ncbi:MAG TPA: carbohydrate binding domain-containing protein [candidate division Zixibacteria bacterium]|nr:carbohydrate binding domain-containing protein [candidate division Zixibacteria bacterium]
MRNNIKYCFIILFLAFWLTPASAVYPNIALNPGFESGTSPWIFYTNGGGTLLNDASGAGSPHAGHVKISVPGTNVQLFQSGIVLEPNTVYKLSFKAYSNTGHDVTVSLLKHGSPYTNYGLSNFVVNLGSTWGSYSKQFTTSGFTGTVNDARLIFGLSPYDAAGDQYYFDDIILTKVSSVTPTPSPTPPASNNQLTLLDKTFTHNTTISYVYYGSGKKRSSGKAFTFFNLPSVIPTNLVSPINYAQGTLYQRLQVITKPSTKTVQYQICVFQDEIIAPKHVCSELSNLKFTSPGTYYASQSMTSLYQYGVIDWRRALLIEMLVIKDVNGIPVDDRYSISAGLWSGSPNFNLYYPMKVRYTAIIVPPGGGSPVWPS